MHTPPFHRRVLLLVFIIMFLAVAPAAIFYTAGYRWNPKKGAIERNGTLIIDTLPEGAKILLNGKVLGKISPVTQQDVAPGSYRIRLEIQGYFPWEKTLEVRPERVTFVNDVILWPNADPQIVESVASRSVRVSPNGRFIAYLRERDGSVGATIRDVSNGDLLEFSLSISTFEGEGRLIWNGDSTAVYVEDALRRSWIIQRTRRDVVALPVGMYRWSGNDLVGVVEGDRYTYDVSRGTTARNTLSEGVIDEHGGYDIVRSATSTDSALRDQSSPNRHYKLPRGEWLFMDVPNDMVALTNGASAFIFRDGEDPAAGKIVPVNGELYSMRIGGEEEILTAHENEIWLTLPDEEPEILLRTSVPIRAVAWHRLGRDVLYATPTEIVVLNLDARDGRMETVIAHFDEIFGFTNAKNEVFVSARKGDTTGVWSIKAE